MASVSFAGSFGFDGGEYVGWIQTPW